MKTSVRRRRRGSLYTGVLLVSLMVAMIGLASLQIAHITLREADEVSSVASAQLLARSAVEYAVLQVRNNPQWRTTFQHNVPYPTSGPITLGNGKFSFRLLDSDGNLADDESDAVRVLGVATIGEATWAESVLLLPTGSAVSSLNCSICSGGNLALASGACVESNQRVAAAGQVSVSGSQALLAAKYIDSGMSISGNAAGLRTAPAAVRKMPSDTCFEYYLARGAYIEIEKLPTSSGAKRMGEVVLGPGINPYGVANPEGIYILDCKNTRVTLADLRVVGTLVLLDPGPNSSLTGRVSLEPAISNYPALLVRGNFQFAYQSDDFLRESNEGTNFNPNGAPARGVTDSDLNDNYPSMIRGLVYVTGTLHAPADGKTSVSDGVLLAGSMLFESSHRVRFSPLFATSPPPGFAQGNPMVIAPGTWRRETTLPSGGGMSGETASLPPPGL